MNPNRHHLWLGRPFAVQHIVRVMHVGIEIVRGGHGAAAELSVVVGEAVWNHKVIMAANARPVRQIIVVRVGIV